MPLAATVIVNVPVTTPAMSELKVVTLDGPAGAGKSTTARQVAQALGWRFLDTGAMYRGLTVALLRLIRQQTPAEQLEAKLGTLTPAQVEYLLAPVRLEAQITDDATRISIDGEPIPDAELRSPEVARAIKVVADNPAARKRCSELQRHLALIGPLVTEGRDQGSTVFPDAAYKFYLTASIEERARRRFQEFAAKGIATTYQAVLQDMVTRDSDDQRRPVGALVRPKDSMVIDTTGLTPQEVVERILRHVHLT